MRAKYRKPQRFWKKEEIRYLADNAGKMSDPEIAERIGRTRKSVCAMRHRMMLESKPDCRHVWTEEMVRAIKKYYPALGATPIAYFLNVTESAARHKASACGIYFNGESPVGSVGQWGYIWNESRVRLVREWYSSVGAFELSRCLGASVCEIRKCAKSLGLSLNRTEPKKSKRLTLPDVVVKGRSILRWSPRMDAILSKRYAEDGANAVACILNVSESSVRQRASFLGLKRYYRKKCAAGSSLQLLKEFALIADFAKQKGL